MANTKIDYAEAMARLEAAPYDCLAEWCYESHKDFYGVKGRHMSGWSRLDLLEWVKSHFVWDNDNQYWRNAVPFVED
jgi:hypothetical protein